MLLGIILGVLALIACSMFITKRGRNKKFQSINHKFHKINGFIMLVLGLIHLFTTWGLRKQRPFMMYVLGIAMILCVVILIMSFYLKARLGKKWKVIHRIAAVLILVILCGHVYYGIHSLKSYKKQVSQIAVEKVDLKQVDDGEYIGEKNVGYIYGKVKVQVKNHVITSIEILEHRTEQGEKAEKITKEMLNQQSNKVDAVSGATNSSKVIMKAVENALQKGVH